MRRAWAQTLAIARALQARIVVFQCPARFTSTGEHVENLRGFFRSVARAGLTLAWEPRGEWPPELVASLCAELNLVHVVDRLRQAPESRGLRYFRLHGLTGYRHRHSDAELTALAARCDGTAPACVLFNNLAMAEDAMHLQARLEARRATGRAGELTDPVRQG